MPTDELLSIAVLPPDLLGESDYTVAVIGPGTGPGAVGLRKHKSHISAIVGEASHGGFSPESRLQIELLSELRDQFERVSCERLVSGPGLENLYWALARIHGENRPYLSAPETFRASIDISGPVAHQAVGLYYETLGQIAGDLALSLGTKDGVYIAGGRPDDIRIC